MVQTDYCKIKIDSSEGTLYLQAGEYEQMIHYNPGKIRRLQAARVSDRVRCLSKVLPFLSFDSKEAEDV